MFSEFAKKILGASLSKDIKGDPKPVDYSITISDTRDTPTVATYNFKFKTPINEDLVNTGNPLLTLFSDNLITEGLGFLPAIYSKLGVDIARVGKKRSTGRVNIVYGESTETAEGTGSIRGRNGRFISIAALKSVLEILTKKYALQEMSKGTPILVNRTGRFINSIKVERITTQQSSGRITRPTVSIGYDYRTNPYSVFDPRVSSYRGLSSTHRNPQRIIGEALAKALRDVLDENRYNFKVYQETQ